MSRNHMIALVAGLLSASMAGFLSRNVDVVITRGMPEHEEPVLLFDCPVCGLPAEIAVIITEIVDPGETVTNYIINCLGEHNKVAVTEKWLLENARAE